MNIIIITGASSGMGLEFALQLDEIFDSIDEIWLIARRKKKLLEVAAFRTSFAGGKACYPNACKLCRIWHYGRFFGRR